MNIDIKLTYISRLFQKTSGKIYEHYVITRIWHLLNNDQIEMISQQCVKLENRYILTDIYFPQFDIHVEINEPAHYTTPSQIDFDNQRNASIINISKHQLIIIDCRKSIREIHEDIDAVIQKINSLILLQNQTSTFVPWIPAKERNPFYWKDKNIIKATDKIKFDNIEDICTLFEADFAKTKRGFLRRGAIAHPKNKKINIWWPSNKQRKGWRNIFDENNEHIIEDNSNSDKSAQHLLNALNSDETRLVFWHHTDFLNITSYHFKGIFKLDILASKGKGVAVWKKIGNEFNLETIEFK